MRTSLAPALATAFAESLGTASSDYTWRVSLCAEDPDGQTILFQYPTIEKTSSYVRPTVRLELGARGDPRPSVPGTVQPYAADVFPHLLPDGETKIPHVVAAQRTFWEKATILHTLYYWPEKKELPPRMARHYYDTLRLAQHELGRSALADPELLAAVVEHKAMFFASASARYDLATPGTLRLTPADHLRAALEEDSEQMAEEMIFDEVPGFSSVLDDLERIEQGINE